MVEPGDLIAHALLQGHEDEDEVGRAWGFSGFRSLRVRG